MRYSVEQSKTYAINLTSRISGQPLAELTHLNIHCAIKILPRAFDLDIGFIHAPALAHRAFVLAERFFEQRYQFDHPPMHGRMVDADGALSHHLYMNASRLRGFFVCSDDDRMGCSSISGLVAA